MADKFSDVNSVMSSARTAFSITVSDSVDITNTPKAIYVGGGGTVVALLVDDSSTVSFVGVAAGTILPIRPKRIYSTGTTATSIVGLY